MAIRLCPRPPALKGFNMAKNNSLSIGISGLLGVAFVVLKLCGVINWSWWWVTAPFWGLLAILLAVLAATIAAIGIAAIISCFSK